MTEFDLFNKYFITAAVVVVTAAPSARVPISDVEPIGQRMEVLVVGAAPSFPISSHRHQWSRVMSCIRGNKIFS